MNFVRGDLVQIKDVPGVQNALRGREAIVVSPLLKYKGTYRHHIELTDTDEYDGFVIVAAPDHLLKLPPPNTPLDSWRDCVFQPRRNKDEKARR